MSSLADFLLARIAEDETVAHEAIGTAAFQQQTAHWSFEHVTDQYGPIPLVFAVADGGGRTQVARLDAAWEPEQRGSHIARWDPARVLAECDAKRRIVKAWGHVLDATDTDPFTRQVHETAGHVFRCLALPYAEHEDYRQEWKP